MRGIGEPIWAGRSEAELVEPRVWLANQLCDLVQIRTAGTGNVVRLHKHR
ncbi:MAG: hypothetical protein M3179_14195 [Actinomycetota bacterium]|nr:hypothetical protein [Actinomycetota bacterium]